MKHGLPGSDLRGHEEERALPDDAAAEDDGEGDDVGDDLEDADDDAEAAGVDRLGAAVRVRGQVAEDVPALGLNVTPLAGREEGDWSNEIRCFYMILGIICVRSFATSSIVFESGL